MLGFLNVSPCCGKEPAIFSLEEMECDQALMAHCRHCGEPLSLTITLETLRRWWLRYEAREEKMKPPIPKEYLASLFKIEENSETWCEWGKIEIHLKHFKNYRYTEEPPDATFTVNNVMDSISTDMGSD
ncbi:MAG: hypothetical protein K0Q90_1401 [Paenibacillaceae bacterium]|jgi:hypothetical protein|nr:hypothetical protein [Paenibacillaceae bacterium]